MRHVALAAVGLAAVAIVVGCGRQTDACTDGPARTGAVWTPEARERVTVALAKVAWATPTLASLDGHVTRWQASYRTVCHGEPLRDLRMRCLDRNLAQFAALADTLGSALDGPARAAAPAAVATLAEPSQCETLASPAELALPTHTGERARATAIERELDHAWAAYALGRYADARTIVARTDTVLASVRGPRLRAASLLLGGAIDARVGDPAVARSRLEAALVAATEAGAIELAYEIWVHRLRNELFARNAAQVVEWATLARTAASRAGHDTSEIDAIVGDAMRDLGTLDAARDVLVHAVSRAASLRPRAAAWLEMNLGSVELAAGNATAALVMFTRARDRILSAVGDHHPDLALYADQLAAAQRARGLLREALALHDTSLTLRTAAFGPSHHLVATSLLARAKTHLEAGDLRAARADATQARTLFETTFGATSARIAESIATQGDIIAAAGSHDEATAYYERAAFLDLRLDLVARRFVSGIVPAESAIAPLAPGETPSVDRIIALAARVSALAAAKRPHDATELAAALRTRYSPGVDPAIASAIGAALLAAGDRVAATPLLADTAKALGNQPTRTALRIWIALAHAADTDPAAAARAAISLYQAMPALERGPVYDEMWAISRRP